MSIITTGSYGYYGGRLGLSTGVTGSVLQSTFNSTNAQLGIKILLQESKTLSDIVLTIGTQAGSGCDLTIDIQLSTSTSIPSGTSISGFTPQTISAASIVANSPNIITLNPGNNITLAAYTTYWLIIGTTNGTASNYFQLRYGVASTSGSGNHACLSYNNKTGATWSVSSSTANACGVVIRFSDGSELGNWMGASGMYTTLLVYGQRYVRYNFFVPTSILSDGIEVRTGCQGAPLNLVYTLRDSTNTTIASGQIPSDSQYVSSTPRANILQWSPQWLTPGSYSLTLQQDLDFGNGSAYWSAPTFNNDAYVASITRDNVYAGPLQVSLDYTTDGGTTWVPQTGLIPAACALCVISIGDFSNAGTISLDSTIKDGATGSSVRMRSASDIEMYSYRRYYGVSTSGSKTYSVKMRRSATTADQPALQQVRLIKQSDGSVLTTLTADANANGAFYTYTSGSLTLSAGDVIYILFETSIKPGQDNTQGFAWFDTESWS